MIAGAWEAGGEQEREEAMDTCQIGLVYLLGGRYA